MKVLFNIDKTIAGDEDQQKYFTTLIENRLLRFQSIITRIEVHLTDVNGKKEGHHNIQCVMEARIIGREPVAVTNKDNTTKRAITGAIDKVKISMDTSLGRLHSNEH